MESPCGKLKIGDNVMVNKTYNIERRKYSFMPNLSGKIGTVTGIQTETELGTKLEIPIFTVAFSKPFLVGIIGEHTIDKPKSWEPRTTWVFCDHLSRIV